MLQNISTYDTPIAFLRIYILMVLLLVAGIGYLWAQDVEYSLERKQTNNVKSRYGEIFPEEQEIQILTEQSLHMMREKKKREYEEYLLNRPMTGYSGVLEADSLALVELYYSTGGDKWKKKDGWLTDPVRNWYGVSLDLQERRVRWIFLDDNNLTGTIPDEIGELDGLVSLDLANNNITGSIPATLGDARNLVELILRCNKLSGPIPSELGQLNNLTHLWLDRNDLEGEIPKELGNLSDLRFLWLHRNQLTGSIPSELTQLINLEQLTLYNNKLTGTIPHAAPWSNLNKLRQLDLDNNQLSGEIPIAFGDLSSLVILNLGINELVGEIPSALAYLENLRSLYLYRNKLSGSIPGWLGNLENLKYLYLFWNKFSGPIPDELGKLKKLEALNLGSNDLSGQIPVALCEATNLDGLWLYDNKLTGSIPHEIEDLKKLEVLSLYSNELTGSIPMQIGELPELTGLYLDFNNLTGPIPVELHKLSKLIYLDFSTNELTGPIPPELGLLGNLEELHLYENALTDTIPHSLGNLSNLKMLSLGRNKLKESKSLLDLQTALLSLTELKWFLADGNEFTKFPVLRSLPKLDTLEIHNNRLHFDSIEPNIGIKLFRYAPQDSIGPARQKSLYTGQTFTVDLLTDPENFPITVGGAHNQYQWFKGNALIPGANSHSYVIDQAEYLDTGHYILRITNTVATACTLYSRPITIMVTETVKFELGKDNEIDCATLGLIIIADVEHTGNVRVLFFNSEPKPGAYPVGIFKIAGLYFTFDADPSLRFSNAKIKIPLKELTDRGIDPTKLKWLRRPEPGTGDWIDLKGEVVDGYFVSVEPFDGFSEFTFGLTEVTFVDQQNTLPAGFQLYQNYPNPFNPVTTIRYSIPDAGYVTLKIFDILGREVTTLVNEYKPAGIYDTKFEATVLPTGVYVYRLEAGVNVQHKKLVLLK